MYQSVPYIQAIIRYLERLETARGGGLLIKLGKKVSGLFDVTRLIANVKEEEVREIHRILGNIANTLKSVVIEFGYLYEEEPYPGTLLYDLGMDRAFANHANYVYSLLKGAKKVITVDPHTTHLLRCAYPRYVKGFNVEVINYLELLAERGYRSRSTGRYTIHDPCLYARYEDIIEPQRAILNVGLIEPEMARENTVCCGGPIEFIAPRFSRKIAKDRIAQLKEASENVITLCPICLGNLRRWGEGEIRVQDIALLL